MARPLRPERRRRGEPERAGEPPQPALAPAPAAALLALQRQAGNQAVARLLARSRAAGPRLQRMQLTAADPGTVDSDPVVLMNMRHARAINQGRGVDPRAEKIASLGDAYSGDDIDFDHDEIVFLHGHGATGLYRDDFILQPGAAKKEVSYAEAAEVIASRLNTVSDDRKRGRPYTIRILTCRAGDPGMEQGNPALNIGPLPSLVKALQQKLANAESEIQIKGFAREAFSYPGFKTHQQPDVFTDQGYENHLKAPFAAFKAWLEGEGAGSSYPQRLAKIEELVPQSVVEDFMQDTKGQGAYVAKDLPPDDARQQTFVTVFNKATHGTYDARKQARKAPAGNG
jgi:hypothetical protein